MRKSSVDGNETLEGSNLASISSASAVEMNRSRLSFVRGCGMLAVMLFLACPLFADSSDRKNVLIFFIDDLRPELNCYGADSIKSPAIDKLAKEGVLFERAYCQQALCAPSRISMMTGQYPDNTGISGLFTPLTKVQPKALTLPGYFRKRGYVTCSYGKVYHHGRDDSESWSDLVTKSAVKYANPKTLEAIKQRVAEGKKKGLGVDEMRTLEKGPAVEMAEVEDEAYPDGQVANQAIESLRKNRDRPFLMCVGFAKPHLPFAAPKRYWDLYERDLFDVPDRGLPVGAPSLAFTPWGELRAYLGMPEQGPLTDDQTKELKHGYAACVSYADAQVGKVMAELERLGLREKTIVILWGDHGYKLGEFGAWCKHTNFELDTRVPFIVSAPGRLRGGRSKSFVEMVDIFPTLAELTGGEVPARRDGLSLEPLLRDPGHELRSYALSQYARGSTMGYSLRDGRWRYTEWIQSGTKKVVFRELYDHHESPVPAVNLADDPERAELVTRLSEQLDAARRVGDSKVYQK
ncbi:sulfatase [Haloferula rosea]|uniref:Sulfatase n=1 Tax=Haloferula rosea TaxID=490093 RepID=A0A934VEF5_9BACT|nr:sulfatase [Haloferula rosea]MBK1825470.1 sulfatase [Haloferula rosea]